MSREQSDRDLGRFWSRCDYNICVLRIAPSLHFNVEPELVTQQSNVFGQQISTVTSTIHLVADLRIDAGSA
jgi:hypothetical protein